MVNLIFGIDINKKITPKIARDALVTCVNEADCLDKDIRGKKYSRVMIEKAFFDEGEDFSKPTKESIIKVIDNLALFFKNFRDPNIIEKHYNDMMVIVDKIK